MGEWMRSARRAARTRRLPPGVRGPAAVYVLVGLALWPVPLFGLLHVEASAVVAFVSFFAAGLAALGALGRGRPFRRVLADQEALLVLPWALLTATILWRPNCGYLEGLLFFVLFPPFSVGLAVSLAFALQGLRGGRLLLVGLGLAVAVLGPVYDLGLHPQFYTYNHVFGGVLGPIYDEELAVRPGLFAFRGLTVAWSVLLYLSGRWIGAWRDAAVAPPGGEVPRRPLRHAAGIGAAAFLIGLAHLFAGPLGINTPTEYLRAELGAVHRTEHFDLYYDAASLPPEELDLLAAEHEFHYARLAALLEVGVDERIGSYLYPDPETKARLTGARYTNVAPVWLPDPQTHVLHAAFGDVFPHELAHVFSRSFGLPILNASLSVGLVEGLAVALEPPNGLPSPHDQVSAVALSGPGVAEDEWTPASDLASRLTPLGFWTGRGAVSYTTMGSFVAYLLEAYGPERLKAVYALGDFGRVYGKSAAQLAAEWSAYLMHRPVTARAAGALAAYRFRLPSIFEKPCPHHVPPHRRRHREAVAALAAGDTLRAVRLLELALAVQPAYVPALDAWARVQLAGGVPEAVVERLEPRAADTLSAALALRLGDAHALLGHGGRAGALYESAYRRLPLYARDERALVVLRQALADRGDLIRLAVGGGTPASRAERLAALAPPPDEARLLRALLLAEAGRFGDAAAVLRAAAPVRADAVPAPERQGLLQRRRLAWTARFLLRAGEPGTAQAVAREAARVHRTAGDLDGAERLELLADQARWIEAGTRSF